MNEISRYVAVTLVFLVGTPAIAATDDFDLLNHDVSIVLTPTRLRQSLADVPGSVTVLSADMLQKFGARSVPEALRLVPGMAVTQISGSNYRINYHGTNITAPRRMNVLIDGVSVYRSAFARVDWTALPIAMEDIQRIEVTRGPNSASYGPNSMLAIVNIVSKHPQEVEGTTLRATGGSRSTAHGLVRYAGHAGDATSYRVTLERQQDRGFDSVLSLLLGQTTPNPDHDSSRIDRLNFRSVTDIADNETLDLQLALLNGKQDVQVADNFQSSYPDEHLREYDVNATWRRGFSANHELKVQTYFTENENKKNWSVCIPTLAYLPEMGALWRANPSYVNAIIAGRTPTGGTPTDNALAIAALGAIRSLGVRATMPTCGNANQDYRERRTDIEVQDTFVFSDALRVVSGTGWRRDMATSQTYLGGSVSNETWRVFANVEYKPVISVNINVGGYFETDELTGSSFSPRIALNKHFDGNNTVRLVVSRANRMPNIIEKRANWTYLTTNLTPPLNGETQAYFAQSARAPGDLQEEKIVSTEIGYLGNFPRYGLVVDAKLFDDRLSKLASERLSLNSFAPSNQNSVELRGLEFQVDYTPTERWMIHAGYSHLDNDASSAKEQSQYSKNSGSLALSHFLLNGWRSSLALYKYQAAPLGQSSYGKQDLALSKTYRLGKDRGITTEIITTHLDQRAVQYMFDIGKSAKNSYASMQYYLTLKLTY